MRQLNLLSHGWSGFLSTPASFLALELVLVEPHSWSVCTARSTGWDDLETSWPFCWFNWKTKETWHGLVIDPEG